MLTWLRFDVKNSPRRLQNGIHGPKMAPRRLPKTAFSLGTCAKKDFGSSEDELLLKIEEDAC